MDGVTPLIEARDLSIGHGNRGLIAGIGLRLEPGQILCLLGPNGAGKTTLFRTLLGLIPALAGDIRLHGDPLARLSRVQVAGRLAYVPQALDTPFAFTALDVVLMGAAAGLGALARPGRAEMTRAQQALDRLEIGDLANTQITNLSGGQRQLVLIARALAQNARAILMDEPTASLDFANRLHVARAIRSLAQSGTGVILSSHDPDQAADLCDHALLLNRTGVVATGPVGQTLTAENLSRLYGITVRAAMGAQGRIHFY